MYVYDNMVRIKTARYRIFIYSKLTRDFTFGFAKVSKGLRYLDIQLNFK